MDSNNHFNHTPPKHLTKECSLSFSLFIRVYVCVILNLLNFFQKMFFGFSTSVLGLTKRDRTTYYAHAHTHTQFVVLWNGN